jgi:hypothetical protein
MTKYLWAGLVGLALLLVPSGARAGCFTTTFCCSPVHVDWKANCCFNVSGGPVPQCGPWYLYWPLDAHFGPPAPTGYPYWPGAMTLPTAMAGCGAPVAAPAPMPLAPAVQPAGFQPVGYSYPAPSYWYGR